MMERIDISVPTGWNELSVDQLLEVSRVMDLALTREEVLFVLTCRFGGLKLIQTVGGVSVFTDKEKHRFALQDWQIVDFCKRLSWVLDTVPVDIVSPLGIDGHLNELSFEDYFQADALMFRYTYTGDVMFLRQALRQLGYRKRCRHRVMRRAVSIWWTGVQGYLKELYPNVFAGDGYADEYNPRETYKNIMLMLNDDRPQENETICKTNVHDVLSALESKIEKSKRMEEQIKKGMI